MPNAKYIYCVIPVGSKLDFGPIGLGGQRVYTINDRSLACVVSDAQEEEYSLADEAHLKAHEVVLEKVMRQYEALPIRFGTVAPGTREVVRFLNQHHREFKRLFKKLKGKVEIEIEVLWKEMKQIFDEIVRESRHLQALKASSKPKSRDDLIMAGQFVAARLRQKKERETSRYMKYLKGAYADYRINPAARDELVLYCSFLVDKKKLDQFDRVIEKLEAENRGKIRVRYIGPMPPYSFASVRM